MRNIKKKRLRRPIKKTSTPINLDFELFISFALMQRGISFGSFFASRTSSFPMHFRNHLSKVNQDIYPTLKECFGWSVNNPESLIEDWVRQHNCCEKLMDEIIHYNSVHQQ